MLVGFGFSLLAMSPRLVVETRDMARTVHEAGCWLASGFLCSRGVHAWLLSLRDMAIEIASTLAKSAFADWIAPADEGRLRNCWCDF